MKKPKVVVVGSSNTDMVIKSTRIPSPGETITGGSFLLAPGGKGANQAVAAARLGADVVFVSAVGEDMFGQQALEQYKNEGIDTSYIETFSNAASGIALILVDDKGENLISVASGANALLTPSHIDRSADLIKSADIVVVQLEIPLETVDHVVKIAAEASVPVVLDPAPVPDAPLPDSLLKNLYCIKPNETEAFRLTGIEILDRHCGQRAIDFLLGHGVQNVMITLGTQGVLFSDTPGSHTILPAEKVVAVDSTAAGDAFTGAFATALGFGKSFAEAARFASTAAALSVTRMGAQPSLPHLIEVSQKLEEVHS